MSFLINSLFSFSKDLKILSYSFLSSLLAINVVTLSAELKSSSKEFITNKLSLVGLLLSILIFALDILLLNILSFGVLPSIISFNVFAKEVLNIPF